MTELSRPAPSVRLAVTLAVIVYTFLSDNVTPSAAVAIPSVVVTLQIAPHLEFVAATDALKYGMEQPGVRMSSFAAAAFPTPTPKLPLSATVTLCPITPELFLVQIST